MSKKKTLGLFGALIAVSVTAFTYTNVNHSGDPIDPLTFAISSSTYPYADTTIPATIPAAAPTTRPTTVYTTTTVPYVAPVFANADNNSNTAFNTMMSGSGGLRHVWREEKVTINGTGLNGGRNMEILEETIEHINALKYPNVPYLELTSGTGDIVIHALNKAEWSSVLGNFVDKSVVDGLTRTIWEDDGSLIKSTIVVDSSSSQWQRNRTLVHEVLHSLGLGHHRCPSGMLEESATYSPTWKMQDFDDILLRMHYASAEDLAVLSSTPVPCARVEWETVNDSDTNRTLWCAVGADPRGCLPASAVDVPSTKSSPIAWIVKGALLKYNPELYTAYSYDSKKILCKNTSTSQSYECSVAAGDTFGSVSLWLRDGTIYDYNVDLYLRFEYNGSKLLCYIPSGDQRSECQYTESNSIDAVDAWTDGVRVYGSSR